MSTTGLFQHPLFNRHFFATPAVRHLAWLVHSRTLLTVCEGRNKAQPWPADVDERLLALDESPEPLLEHLSRRPSNRLGLYFEQLYGFALTALLGQRILAQNLPVRLNGRTLGELDFLVHDPTADRVVHHEIAVKFYMGWTGTNATENSRPAECRPAGCRPAGCRPAGWYGPDTRDQLSTKLQRLLEHQIPMWRSDAGRDCLQAQGLAQPEASHLGLYGYLFGHQDGAMPSLPRGVLPPEKMITWRRVSEHSGIRPPETFLAALRKPHWLGPLQCPAQAPPDPRHDRELLAEAGHRPLLLATMRQTENGFWLESGRQFVTPDDWCRDTRLPADDVRRSGHPGPE